MTEEASVKPRFSGTVASISPFNGHAIVQLDENEFRIGHAQCWSVSAMVANKGLKAFFKEKRDLRAGDRVSGELSTMDFPHMAGIDQQLPLPEPFESVNAGRLPKLVNVLVL